MNKYVSLLLVLYPLLNIYSLPGLTSFSIAHAILVFLFTFAIMRRNKFSFRLPYGFKLYWCYVSVMYIILAPSFSIGLFIPGGYAFCIWLLLFVLCINYFDYSLFKKYYRIVFICCSVAFLYQEISYNILGSRPLFMLPLPFYGLDQQEILMNQLQLNRSSCFFLEPSHFAQFILPLFAIEIFENSNDKILNGFSLYIIFVLLLLQSGVGFAGLLILLSIRLLTFLKHSNKKYKYQTFLLFIPFLVCCVSIYLRTEVGQGIITRASGLGLSEDAESATRIIKGYFVYSELPFINKLLGYHINEISNFAASSRYSHLFVSSKTGDFALYLNGFQQVLILNGLIGVILLFRIFLSLYKGNNLLSKSLIILFISLLFISDQYLSQAMLISLLIPYNSRYLKNSEINYS